MKLTINKIFTVLLAVLCLTVFAACNDDEEAVGLQEGVVFSFSRKLVYTSGVNEIGSVKVTLNDGKQKIVLPSLALTGDEKLVKSAPCALTAGDYRVVAYTAYSTRHEFLFDAELDSKNAFTVEPNTVVEFTIPVKTKEILNYNFLRNALMGLCKQVFGDDDSTWPWNPKKYPYPDWEGLEFELDDYGSPMYLSGITFDGLKDGKETPWVKMTAIPEGTLSNIAELASINVCDIPDFKYLPGDLDRLPSLQQISCIRTGVEELPENIGQLTTLSGIFLIDCQVDRFEENLSALKNLRTFSLAGNQLHTFSTPLQGLDHLISLDLSRNPLSCLEETCFVGHHTLNRLDISHTDLDRLPASLTEETGLRGLDLSACQFTAVPTVLNSLPQLKSVSLDSNKLSRVQPEDFDRMEALESLSLTGNALGSFPVLPNNHLIWLNVAGCGLTQAPAIAAYPDLRVLFLGNNSFTTLPEQYFVDNARMTILNLSGSDLLKTLPDNLGLVAVDNQGKEGLRLVEVENCPNLDWTTPTDWKAYDFRHNNEWIFGLQEGSADVDSAPVELEDDFGRVGVRRSGSPRVKFGN